MGNNISKGVLSLVFFTVFLVCLNAIFVGIIHGDPDYLPYWAIPLAFVLYQEVSLGKLAAGSFDLGLAGVVFGYLLTTTAIALFVLYLRILFGGQKIKPAESEQLGKLRDFLSLPILAPLRDPAVLAWGLAIPAVLWARFGGARVSEIDGASAESDVRSADKALLIPLLVEVCRPLVSLRTLLVKPPSPNSGSGTRRSNQAVLPPLIAKLSRLCVAILVLGDLRGVSRGQWAPGHEYLPRTWAFAMTVGEHVLLFWLYLLTSKYSGSSDGRRRINPHPPTSPIISLGAVALAVISVCTLAAQLLRTDQSLGEISSVLRSAVAAAVLLTSYTLLSNSRDVTLRSSPRKSSPIPKKRASDTVRSDQSRSSPSARIDSQRDPRPKPQSGIKARSGTGAEAAAPSHI